MHVHWAQFVGRFLCIVSHLAPPPCLLSVCPYMGILCNSLDKGWHSVLYGSCMLFLRLWQGSCAPGTTYGQYIYFSEHQRLSSVILLLSLQIAKLVLHNLQNACQSADWQAFYGSSVCATQSADNANSQVAGTCIIIWNFLIILFIITWI